MAFQPGDSLNDGTYIIQEQLSDENYSGFGVTYKAVHRYLNKMVVLKLPNGKLCQDPQYLDFLASFQQEAQTLGRLLGDRHSHIVQVQHLFPVTVAGRAEPVLCMVMEYISGTDLFQRVLRADEQGNIQAQPLTEPDALSYIQQIGSALTHLHQYEPEPILHRDVKPANIMVRSRSNQAVLIDFGLARTFVPNVTKTHTQTLTPGFAPPEQYHLQAKRGAYTDVYGLAATLYFLLTGRAPEASNNRGASLYNFGLDPLESPQKLNPHLSQQVQEAILWGMELKPEDRPQSIQDWLKGLGLRVAPAVEVAHVNKTKTTRDARLVIPPQNLPVEEQPQPQNAPLMKGLQNLGRGVKQWMQEEQAEWERLRQEQEHQRQAEAERQRRAAEQERLKQAALEAERKRKAAELESWNIDRIPLESEKRVDYTKLRDLLKAQRWKEADQETERVMCQAANRTQEGWLRVEDVEIFPCKDLKTIDRLWVEASNGAYGFSVQKKIWKDCGSPTDYNQDWETFGDRVGWRVNGQWKNYSDLNWGGSTPSTLVPGHLPGLLVGRFWYLFYVRRDLFSRVETCKV